MGYQKIMADGTICRTGPNCQRHPTGVASSGMNSFMAALKSKISKPTDDVIPETSYKTAGIADETLSTLKTVRGVNAYNVGRVDVGDDNYDEVQATKPAILRQLDDESKDFEETMPKELRDSIQHYVSSYEPVNHYLRDGKAGIEHYLKTNFNESMFPDMEASVASYIETTSDRIEKMDEAFATYKRPENNIRRLFRSELVPEGVSTEQYLAKFAPDSVIENKSYTSSSIDPDYMLVMNSPHVNKKRIVVFEMLSREGIPVHSYDDFPGAPSFSEREVLLNRGTKFKVKNVVSRKFLSSYPDKKPAGSHGKNGIPSAEYVVVQMEQVN
jgi:hypothetical protein